jgi:hypothetical protein
LSFFRLFRVCVVFSSNSHASMGRQPPAVSHSLQPYQEGRHSLWPSVLAPKPPICREPAARRVPLIHGTTLASLGRHLSESAAHHNLTHQQTEGGAPHADCRSSCRVGVIFPQTAARLATCTTGTMPGFCFKLQTSHGILHPSRWCVLGFDQY